MMVTASWQLRVCLTSQLHIPKVLQKSRWFAWQQKKVVRFSCSMSPSQSADKSLDHRSQLVTELLQRKWMLPDVAADPKITTVAVSRADLTKARVLSRPDDCCSREEVTFSVIRDDLLHPLAGGNKLRKLDALLPSLLDAGATHVVTCGGYQSAHATAVAVCAAEAGLKSTILLRGEPPAVPTGYGLLTSLFSSDVRFVTRTRYADRQQMLQAAARELAGPGGTVLREMTGETGESIGGDGGGEGGGHGGPVVGVIEEGAGNPEALLGLVRLVQLLHQKLKKAASIGQKVAETDKVVLAIDSGTGTTAIGCAIGIELLGLNWHVVGVMLAGGEEYYRAQESSLLEAFKSSFLNCGTTLFQGISHGGRNLSQDSFGELLPLSWVDRLSPRRFGNVLPGELVHCKVIAETTGILLDPIYTLAGWEQAQSICLCRGARPTCSMEVGDEGMHVLMLHTGGTMAMHGLAQRYARDFQKQSVDAS